MKIAFLALLLSFSVCANDLGLLDQRQQDIGEAYHELMLELPSPEEIARLAQTGENDLLLSQSMQKIKSFFNLYDQYNLDKIDFFHEKVIGRAENKALDYIEEYGHLPKKAKKELENLKEARKLYIERKAFFGTPKDTLRLDIGQEVLPHYANFAKAMRLARGEAIWRTFGKAKIVPFIDRPVDFLKTADQFFRLLWNAYVKTRTGKQDKAPIPEALQGIQRRLVKMRGIETNWEGIENLGDLSHDGQTLHMFLINHANSFFDTSAQQSFPVKGISAMGDMEAIFPNFLTRRIVKSDHMIAVGHGDTTGKTIDLVRRKQLNRFFLAIEGITGTGLYEMRPVMPLFNDAVYDSIERGLNLRLHPVAFPDNFRLMNDWRAPIEGDKVAKGVLLPAIDNSACLGLLRATQVKESIGNLIRWFWFSTLKNSKNETLSMRFPSEIDQNLERMIWGND